MTEAMLCSSFRAGMAIKEAYEGLQKEVEYGETWVKLSDLLSTAKYAIGDLKTSMVYHGEQLCGKGEPFEVTP